MQPLVSQPWCSTVCRSLLYRWRRQMRHGELAAVTAAAGLVPVRIAPEVPAVRETKDEPSAAPAPPESTLGSGASLGLVEIVLGNGRVLRVAERIDPAVLARLAAAVGRRWSGFRRGWGGIWGWARTEWRRGLEGFRGWRRGWWGKVRSPGI